jgi:protein-disulfide isomerase
MEHDEMDVNRWVEERLSSLDPPAGWRPDAPAAFAHLQRRETPHPRRWWLWASLSATAAAACAAALLVSTPTACANPLGCSQAAQPVAKIVVPKVVPASFKESGSRTAPVTCELYSDYQCPHCAAFYLDTLPQFTAKYIATGKVRLRHRDFPLERHRYARLAAQYADAAGELGYYDAVARKLFRTQEVWSGDGDIEAQVARVVPASDMEKVRAHAPQISVADDEASARANRIGRTPTLLCNGRVIGPDLSFGQIEAQLDPLVGRASARP